MRARRAEIDQQIEEKSKATDRLIRKAYALSDSASRQANRIKAEAESLGEKGERKLSGEH